MYGVFLFTPNNLLCTNVQGFDGNVKLLVIFYHYAIKSKPISTKASTKMVKTREWIWKKKKKKKKNDRDSVFVMNSYLKKDCHSLGTRTDIF